MNILFSSDDNYARHLGVALISLLQHNRDVEKVRVYVINNRISISNIGKLHSVVDGYDNAEISFIPFESYEQPLHLHLAWPISLSSYARLFVGEMSPTSVDRVIYLDCDVVVGGALSALWNTDLHGKCLGAIQDTIPSRTKIAVGLAPQQPYFNAGVLLIDLNRWREQGIGKQCLDFIEAYRGRVTHHDQGVLNGVFKNQWVRLPLRYNVMTVHYMLSQSNIKKYYNDEATYYDASETKEAIQNPQILHYTPSFTSRPWEEHCCHPMKERYIQVLGTSPWNGSPLIKDNNPWYVRMINLRYRLFPVF